MTDTTRDLPPRDEPGSLETTPDLGASGSADQLDTIAQPTDTDEEIGNLVARPPDQAQPDTPAAESLDFLESLELRSGETDDPYEASQEGMPWIPPTDPPTSGTEPAGDPRIAAGFGMTSLDEPYDASHHETALPGEDEVTARVREALLADAATTRYADRIAIDVVGRTVVLVGTVDDLDDEDELVAVAATVEGVADVRSELAVQGI